MSTVADASQRSRALTHNGSFAVTAPAGSGKTELLTKRLLTLLAYVEQPEEILAITFTRKAANEMRRRIVEALHNASLNAPAEEPHKYELWQLAHAALQRDRDKGWNLLKNPNRLRLQTIDSFGMSLVRRMPLMSHLGTEAIIAEDTERLYQKASRQLLSRLDEDSEVATDIALLLTHLDNNTARVEGLLCRVLARREQWLRHLIGNSGNLGDFKHYLEDCLRELIEETLNRASNVFEPWAPQLMDIIHFVVQNLSRECPESPLLPGLPQGNFPGTECERVAQWHAIADLLLTKSGSWRARLTKNEGFPAGAKSADKERFKQAKAGALELIESLSEQAGALDVLLEIQALPSPVYDERQWLLLGALTNLLPLLVAELLLIFREQGVVDYQQITIASLDALGSSEAPTDLALLLDYRLKHILVDEFQDTASAQFSLLARLTEGWQPGDGRTFFIVGDGMQSCYGFRDANVGLFLAARQFGIGYAQLTPLELTVNFRSQQGIVDWVNRTFQTAFPEQDDIARGAVKYAGSLAYNQVQETDCVSFYACLDDPQRALEANKVVELIQQARSDTPTDSIAVLVRNRRHLDTIIPQLQRANIEWIAVDIEPLAQQPLVSDLLALTLSLLSPTDDISWLAVLRAPWCGLSLEDLEIVSTMPFPLWQNFQPSHGQQSNLCQPVEDAVEKGLTPRPLDQTLAKMTVDGQTRFQRMASVLEPALTQRARKPLRQWIEGIWLALGGPATAPSDNALHQIEAYFELLERHEAGADIEDIAQFKTAVDGIYAKPAMIEDSSQAPQAVQIMTIHRAKGLEFDQVIIPGLDRYNPSRKGELLRWHERLSATGESQLLISPLSAKGGDEDKLYRYLKREQSIKDRLENTRLAYVAATRAAKKLSLLANVKQHQETGTLSTPATDSLLHCIWNTVRDQAILLKPESVSRDDQQVEPEHADFHLTRLVSHWRPPQLPAGNLLAAYRGHEYHNEDMNIPVDSPDSSSSDSGLEHNLDEMLLTLLLGIADQGVENWERSQGKDVTGILNRLIPVIGFQSNHRQQLTAIEQVVEMTLCDQWGRWILSDQHSDCKTNMSLALNERGIIYNFHVPRSFIVGGEQWLIKFDMMKDLSSLENGSIGSLHPDTRSELGKWAEAVSAMAAIPVKTAIYFPFLRKFEVIEDY